MLSSILEMLFSMNIPFLMLKMHLLLLILLALSLRSMLILLVIALQTHLLLLSIFKNLTHIHMIHIIQFLFLLTYVLMIWVLTYLILCPMKLIHHPLIHLILLEPLHLLYMFLVLLYHSPGNPPGFTKQLPICKTMLAIQLHPLPLQVHHMPCQTIWHILICFLHINPIWWLWVLALKNQLLSLKQSKTLFGERPWIKKYML